MAGTATRDGGGSSSSVLRTIWQPITPPQWRKLIKGIGGAKIIIGVISIILSSIMLSYNDQLVTDYAGSGIWFGLVFFVTGCCALHIFEKASTDTMVAAIIMSIFSLLMAISMIAVISNSLKKHAGSDVYPGLQALEGLLLIFGVAGLALSACCMMAAIFFLRLSRQSNHPMVYGSINRGDGGDNQGASSGERPSGIDNTANGAVKDPTPFSTMQHVDTMKWTGLWQIVVSVASIIIGIVLLMQKNNRDGIAEGIWCGIIFFVTGILAFLTAAIRSTGMVIATMVMSIISSLILWNVITWSSIRVSMAGSCSTAGPYCKERSEIATESGLLLVLSIGELIMSLWCAYLCCKTICRSPCCPCCIPQVVLHIQEGGGKRGAAQGGSQVVAVTETSRDYAVGPQIHVQICLVHGREQTSMEQPQTSGAAHGSS